MLTCGIQCHFQLDICIYHTVMGVIRVEITPSFKSTLSTEFFILFSIFLSLFLSAEGD
jgi:hypothetical protein